MEKGAKYTLIVCLIAVPVLLTAAVTAFYWNHIRAEYYFRWGERSIIIAQQDSIVVTQSRNLLHISRIPVPEHLIAILVADKRVRKSFLQSSNIQKFLEAASLAWNYKGLTLKEKELICRRYIALLEDTRWVNQFWNADADIYSNRVCNIAAIELCYFTKQSFGLEYLPVVTGKNNMWYPGTVLYVPENFTTDPEEAKKAIAQWEQWYEENKDGELFPALKELQ